MYRTNQHMIALFTVYDPIIYLLFILKNIRKEYKKEEEHPRPANAKPAIIQDATRRNGTHHQQ